MNYELAKETIILKLFPLVLYQLIFSTLFKFATTLSLDVYLPSDKFPDRPNQAFTFRQYISTRGVFLPALIQEG